MNSKINNYLGLLKIEVTTAIKEAYDEGYLNGIVVAKPTQAEFHKVHSNVLAYGEDQDMLVLSGKFTYGTAAKRFQLFLIKECGLDSEEIGEPGDHMQRSSISFQPNEDYDGEPTYYLRADRGGVFDCWLWEMDV